MDITRVGELRKMLESYSDDDMVYANVARDGHIDITLIKKINEEKSVMCRRGIYNPPLTNKLPEELILNYEKLFKTIE